ncbi:MAG: nitrilase-related carbon-nitrogen hydrolase [Phycisphaerales bacterium]
MIWAMHAHLLQIDPAWEDAPTNFAAAAASARLARPAPGDLVVLPEMFDTGFSMNVAKTTDRGATLDAMGAIASEHGVCVVGGRTVAGAAGKGRNVATAVGPGGEVLCEYTKCHPFTLGGEHLSFESGDGPRVFEWKGLRIAPIICYDLRFPELFRRAMVMGAEAFVVIACWPATRHAHWRALLPARAIENQAYVLGCNRSGSDPKLEYMGGSMAVSPTGETLAETFERGSILKVEVDPGAVRRWREKFPAWKDHRFI